MGCLVKARGRQGIAIFLLALLPALFVPSSGSYAEENKIPYGSSCYEQYGARGNTKSISYAIGAVRKYFHARGYYVKLVEHTMRFLTVEVLDGEELIDTVVVDIRTGKMRSVQ
ncbi:hypothetical protein LCGC14_1241110 [marine sediment metagenome]|uniref:Uncharacterized protein n=1 Tax=marine sediment metagenome TaxID=412755 RepID=A0A0F9NMY4_9ZZZZ